MGDDWWRLCLTGHRGYLTLQGQKNLALAVTLFNQRHNKAVLGVGVAPQQAGFVYKF